MMDKETWSFQFIFLGRQRYNFLLLFIEYNSRPLQNYFYFFFVNFLFSYLYPMKKSSCSQLSFADQIVSERKVKDVFFSQINQLIDWKPIAGLIKKVYTKGNSSTGRSSV